MAGILDFLNSPDAQLGIGLLAAGGPTTDPNQVGLGQRLSAGMQNMRASQLQEAQIREAQQKALLQGVQLQNEVNWQNMLGGNSQPLQGLPQSTPSAFGAPQQQPMSNGGAAPGGAPAGGPSAPMAAGGGQPQGGGSTPPGFPVLPGHTPQESMQIALGMGRGPYMQQYATQTAPGTDIQKLMAALKIDPQSPQGQAMLSDAALKANNIPLTAGRAGAPMYDHNGNVIAMAPKIPDNAIPTIQNGRITGVTPLGGASGIVASNNEAQERGKGNINTKPVWDDTANNGRGGFVDRTQSQVADASTGGAGSAPAPMRGNNPGALMPGGKLAQYPDMQTGLAALDNNLQSYGKQGVNTVAGVISKWAPPTENNTQAYIADVSQRLGIKPDQQIDLSNPLHRQALSTAIALHENGPQGVFGSGGGGQSGPMASQPPLGQTKNADAAQTASAQTMQDSYKKLQSGNSTANAALDALTKMQGLAANKNAFLTAGPLGTNQSAVNPDAAEYEKQRANVIALLANQNGTNGTDAGRALTGESVPDFGKPKDAIKDGLSTLANQTKAQQLKINLLTPLYQAGDSKGYTELENQFDQTVKPSMIPQIQALLSMPSGPQRFAALKLARTNSGMNAALELMAKGGLFK